ncbi:MAG: Imm1 family immunity protein [Planctomycetota bacterium]
MSEESPREAGQRWELFLDCGVGHSDHGAVIASPTETDFRRALTTLDARERTLLSLTRDESTVLMVGGGAGQYVVTASVRPDEHWALRGSAPAYGEIELTAGGQPGLFDASQVVDFDQALLAGLWFLASGALDPRQEWVSE